MAPTNNTEHEEHLQGLAEARAEMAARPLRVKAYAVEEVNAPQVGATKSSKPNVKVVHFVRHGQGFHNLMADVYRAAGRTWTQNVTSAENPYTMLELVDAPLTETGRQQALALQVTARAMESQVELVVLSPNCRALHTGCLVFEHLQGQIPFLAHEMVREEHGVHVCDRRRSKARQAHEFPAVDFSLLEQEEDMLWKPDHRETKQELANRVYQFFEWLASRPEQHVGVASHSAWLLTAFNTNMDCGGDAKLQDWFATGELRSVVLEFVKEPIEE